MYCLILSSHKSIFYSLTASLSQSSRYLKFSQMGLGKVQYRASVSGAFRSPNYSSRHVRLHRGVNVRAHAAVHDVTADDTIFSQEAFDKFVSEAGDSILILDCYTSWCGPCKMISPKVEEVAQELPKIKFAKMNLEKCESKLTSALQVKSLPTFIAYKKGEKQGQFVGANYKQWRQWVFCFA